MEDRQKAKVDAEALRRFAAAWKRPLSARASSAKESETASAARFPADSLDRQEWGVMDSRSAIVSPVWSCRPSVSPGWTCDQN